MFKDFMISVVALAFFASVCEMIMPEGTVKKYIKLTIGFMMMAVMLNPIVKNLDGNNFKFSFDNERTNEEIKAESDAYILKLHEENIVDYVKKFTGDTSDVYVELYSDGNVKSVTIRNSHITYDEINILKKELGCEKIENITGG